MKNEEGETSKPANDSFLNQRAKKGTRLLAFRSTYLNVTSHHAHSLQLSRHPPAASKLSLSHHQRAAPSLTHQSRHGQLLTAAACSHQAGATPDPDAAGTRAGHKQ
jgi:hypothetical protein